MKRLRHIVRTLLAHPRPGRFLAARVLQRSGLSRMLIIEMGDYRLRFYPTNLSSVLWIGGADRVHGLELFRDVCVPGDCAVDVGANIGETTIILSRCVGARGTVYAFEPHPKVFSYLQGNLRLNACRNVLARRVAVGPDAGYVSFLDSKWDDMNRVVSDGPIEVECSTLDRQLPEDARVAFLKIDVEGLEVGVLAGATRTLSQTEVVNCEMGAEHYARYGSTIAQLIGMLKGVGFETYVIAGVRTLRVVDEGFSEAGGYELVALRTPREFIRRTSWTITG